ncbi:MAG: hypothetical protein K2X90_01990 [Candidatus Babeliaceae bacterium]|nr:hypothetical protein [Candidatus Babeliaceae bacterium]
MKYLALALVILSTLAFVGCGKKKVEVAKPVVVTEQTIERVSGPMPVEIIWEETDGK